MMMDGHRRRRGDISMHTLPNIVIVRIEMAGVIVIVLLLLFVAMYLYSSSGIMID